MLYGTCMCEEIGLLEPIRFQPLRAKRQVTTFQIRYFRILNMPNEMICSNLRTLIRIFDIGLTLTLFFMFFLYMYFYRIRVKKSRAKKFRAIKSPKVTPCAKKSPAKCFIK